MAERRAGKTEAMWVRLAMTTLGCPAWDASRAFAAAAEMGYAGIELRCLEGHLLGPALEEPTRREIRRLAVTHNLPIVAVGASSQFSSPDAAVRAAQEADLRGMLQLAAEIGAPLVRAYGGGNAAPSGALVSDGGRSYGGNFPQGQAEDTVIGWIVASLERVLPYAQTLGVDIVLETHDGLSSAHRMAAVLERLPDPHLGALWDVLHPTRLGETPQEVWSLIGPRVRHVHFKDARRGLDGRWRAVLDGEGDVPLRACLRILRAAGYDGWITLEWEKYWEPEIAEPEVALPAKLDIVRGWLAQR